MVQMDAILHAMDHMDYRFLTVGHGAKIIILVSLDVVPVLPDMSIVMEFAMISAGKFPVPITATETEDTMQVPVQADRVPDTNHQSANSDVRTDNVYLIRAMG